VAEWFKAPVLKTGRGLCSLVSSNLTPSANSRNIPLFSNSLLLIALPGLQTGLQVGFAVSTPVIVAQIGKIG
jgi:hypothetical protein